MKATLEIPDDIYRRVKAKSALQGRAIRDVTIDLYQRWLADEPLSAGPESSEDWLDVWVRLGQETLRDAPSGTTATEVLAADRDRNLRGGERVAVPDADAPGLLVAPAVALRQIEAERAAALAAGDRAAGTGTRADEAAGADGTAASDDRQSATGDRVTPPVPPAPPAPRRTRYFGAVRLDATRVGRDASRIAEEVIGHLAGLDGARVTVTLEIEAAIPDGAPDHVVRIVTENGRALKFEEQGFEDG